MVTNTNIDVFEFEDVKIVDDDGTKLAMTKDECDDYYWDAHLLETRVKDRAELMIQVKNLSTQINIISNRQRQRRVKGELRFERLE